MFLPVTSTAAAVPGEGAPREPAAGRGSGQGGRGGGCATSASPRSIFKAASGLGRPPALPSLAPPGPHRSGPRLGVSRPGIRGGGEGPGAAPPPPGARAPRAAPARTRPETRVPTGRLRRPGFLLWRPGRAARASFLSQSQQIPSGDSLFSRAEPKLLSFPGPRWLWRPLRSTWGVRAERFRRSVLVHLQRGMSGDSTVLSLGLLSRVLSCSDSLRIITGPPRESS